MTTITADTLSWTHAGLSAYAIVGRYTINDAILANPNATKRYSVTIQHEGDVRPRVLRLGELPDVERRPLDPQRREAVPRRDGVPLRVRRRRGRSHLARHDPEPRTRRIPDRRRSSLRRPPARPDRARRDALLDAHGSLSFNEKPRSGREDGAGFLYALTTHKKRFHIHIASD